MVYCVVSRKGCDEFTSFVTEDRSEAVKEAIGEWNLLCDYDRRHIDIEVRAYKGNPEEDFDYDSVDWRGGYYE